MTPSEIRDRLQEIAALARKRRRLCAEGVYSERERPKYEDAIAMHLQAEALALDALARLDGPEAN